MIRPKFLFFITDLALAYICLVLVNFLGFGYFDKFGFFLEKNNLFSVLIYLAVNGFSAYFFELFNVNNFKNKVYIYRRCAFSIFTTFIALSTFFYIFSNFHFGRGLLTISLLVFLFGQIILRLLIRKFSRVSRFASRILIIGAGELAQKTASIIPEDYNPHSYIGFISGENENTHIPPDRIVGNIRELRNLIYDYRPHKLIVALTERRGALPLKEIMHSKLRGIEVFDATSYYEQQTGRLLIENIQPSEFIYTNGFRMTPFMRSYKRIFDILFSCLGLLLAAPLFPIIALTIKLDSAGPILFKQLRVGEREVEFFVYKFRTMKQDAEKETGAVWAQKNDPRVTRVGQIIRKSRLDEIPQLYNVLKGDMSFVGPRPERLAFVERLKQNIPYYSTRHFIKPGVTGLAQVRYSYGASEEDALEKLRYDLFYIKNYSIFLDFQIILDTIRVVASGFGGR